MRKTIGEFGLPYTQVGGVAQSLMDALTDRGFTRKEILSRLESFNEQEFWDSLGGPALDKLQEMLGLEG